MAARAGATSLIVLLLGLGVGTTSASAPYPRAGSTSDRVVHAYFANDTAQTRISMPVCDSGKGQRSGCLNVDVQHTLPAPLTTFDPRRVRQVVFVAVLVSREGAATIDVQGIVTAPDGRPMPFSLAVPTNRSTRRYLIQQSIPRAMLDSAIGEWSVVLSLDGAVVGSYVFTWGDAATLARQRKATDDALSADRVPIPVIPPELLATPPAAQGERR